MKKKLKSKGFLIGLSLLFSLTFVSSAYALEFLQNGNSFGTTATLGTNDSNDLLLETNGITRMAVTNAGLVGIGTTTPAGLLEVATPLSGQGAYFTQAESISSTGFSLNLRRARGTLTVPTYVHNDDLGTINFQGHGGTAGYITAAEIKAFSSGTQDNNRVPGQLSFWTATDVMPSVLTERMTILNNGNVGIGTTAPTTQLEIYKGVIGQNSPLKLTNTHGSAGDSSDIDFSISGSGTVLGRVGATRTLANGDTALTFSTFNATNGTNLTEKMRILNNGNVGIGTSAPSFLFDIKKDQNAATQARISNYAIAGNTLAASGLEIESLTSSGQVNAYPVDASNTTFQDRFLVSSNSDAAALTLRNGNTSGKIEFYGTGGSKMVMDNDGNFGIGTTTPASKLDINSNSLIIETAQTPASSSATCTKGMISWDSNYIYVCVATNTWHRSAHSSW